MNLISQSGWMSVLHLLFYGIWNMPKYWKCFYEGNFHEPPDIKWEWWQKAYLRVWYCLKSGDSCGSCDSSSNDDQGDMLRGWPVVWWLVTVITVTGVSGGSSYGSDIGAGSGDSGGLTGAWWWQRHSGDRGGRLIGEVTVLAQQSISQTTDRDWNHFKNSKEDLSLSEIFESRLETLTRFVTMIGWQRIYRNTG